MTPPEPQGRPDEVIVVGQVSGIEWHKDNAQWWSGEWGAYGWEELYAEHGPFYVYRLEGAL